nr:carboxypeptidase-like regulatory domain-containing protein [uncultured Bacteroides sp.]
MEHYQKAKIQVRNVMNDRISIKRTILFLLYITICGYTNICAQSITISGTITNAEKGTKATNISVFTKRPKIGTISDSKGYFRISLPSSCTNKYLYFTGVGFQKDSILISGSSSLNIKLLPQAYTLKEIYIMPDSTLLTLLRKAYLRIPENYPAKPSLYTGFYRESVQDEKYQQIYLAEAMLSIYKDSYIKKKAEPGEVEILKSRKKEISSSGLLYYGGPFVPINGDAVLQRKDYINPQHFKAYKYKFNGIKESEGHEFYDISYTSAKSDSTVFKGRTLIDKQSLAYVYFERDLENYQTTNLRIKGVESHSKITYEKQNDKYYLKQYENNNIEKNLLNGKNINSTIDYITTDIKLDSVKPIPFERRLGFFEPFMQKTDDYNKKGWTDYNELNSALPQKSELQFSTSTAEQIFNTKSSKKLVFTNKLLKILLKLNFEYGLSFNTVSLNSNNYNFIFNPGGGLQPFTINKQQPSRKEAVVIQSLIGYRLSKNLSIFMKGTDDYFNSDISSNEHYYGIQYRKNLKSTGRPLFFEPSIAYCYKDYFVNLGTYSNSTSFHFGGEKIDARRIAFAYGLQQKTIAPQIAFSKRISRFASLKLFGTYNIPLDTKKAFRIKEKSGFFVSRKSATAGFENNQSIINNSELDIWNSLKINRFQVGITITLL